MKFKHKIAEQPFDLYYNFIIIYNFIPLIIIQLVPIDPSTISQTQIRFKSYWFINQKTISQNKSKNEWHCLISIWFYKYNLVRIDRIFYKYSILTIKERVKMANQYIVRQILDRRLGKKGKIEYLIHWEDYKEEQSTWEPTNNLVYVKEMVEEFDKKYEEQGPKVATTPSQPIKIKKMQSPPILAKKQKIMIKKEEKAKNFGGKKSRCKIEQPKYKYTEQKEKLNILGLCVDSDGQYLYLVQSNIGMKSYKTRSYLLKEHPENLLCFYQKHIKLGAPESP